MPRLTFGVLLLATCTVAASLEAGGQKLRELARAHSQKYPGTPLLQVGPLGDYLPKTIEELTREAEVVLHARLVRLKSYVGADGERVLSDFAIRDNLMLAARTADAAAAVQGASQTLIVTEFGGELMIEGVEVRSSAGGRAAITDGGEYLLFLKNARRPGPGRYGPTMGLSSRLKKAS